MISESPRVSDSHCSVDDAELYVRSTGDGPPLLLISGGIGAADDYRALVTLFSNEYTVVTYDRRGHFRSTDRTEGPISVTRHAEDANAVLEHLDTGRATVFGTSAGALIGLELVVRHPDAVLDLVAHEPPAVRLLPDAGRWLDAAAHQVTLAADGDLMGAFTRFAGAIAGAGLPGLRTVRLSNKNEWAFLFEREIMAFFDYLPDLAVLRKSPVDITPIAGAGSRGRYHYQPAKVLALELGLPFCEVPGAHLAPQRNPAQLAEALRGLFMAP
jgi:pimeloyl-ACP methyl ester carboxylesterase